MLVARILNDSEYLSVRNQHGVEVATLQSNKDKDGMVARFDRYGELGWGQTQAAAQHRLDQM